MTREHLISSQRRYRTCLLRLILLAALATGHWNFGIARAGEPSAAGNGPEYVQLDTCLLPQAPTTVSGRHVIDDYAVSTLVPASAVRDPGALGKIAVGIEARGIDPPVTSHLIAAQSSSSGL